MVQSDGERRLAAILAADVVGYSRLMGLDEAGTLARLKALRLAVVEPEVARRRGRIVKLMGDGILAEFASVVDAVACALAVQQAVAAHEAEVAEPDRIRLRIGLNLGDVIVEGDDLYGDGINIAARLEALAEPGGIIASATVADHAQRKVEARFEPLGERRLKNIAEPVRVFRVVAAGDATPAPGHAAPRRRIVAGAVVAAVFAVVAGAGGWWLLDWHRPIPEAADGDARPSVAVLPFADLGDERSYMADGMTEDLITDLTKIAGVRVIGQNAVASYRGQSPDPRDVARDLGVRYVVEGSVRREGDRLRINAQLVDTAGGTQLWAERYDRAAGDVFAVQDDVVGHIITALRVRLSPDESRRPAAPPTEDLEAYDNFLRAEGLVREGRMEDLAEAMQLYDKAIALDPAFAAAYAAGARLAAYIWRNDLGFVMPPPVARKRAYELAGRALSLDPTNPVSFAVLAQLQVTDRQFDQALTSARRAVEVAPGDAAAQATLALVLAAAGEHAAAADAARTAHALDPQLPGSDQIGLGLALLLAGDREAAVARLEAAKRGLPEDDLARSLLAAAEQESGRNDAARAEVAEVLKLLPHASLASYREALGPLRLATDRDRLLAAMAQAGIPALPYGFDAKGLRSLSAAEIRELVLGRTLAGELGTGEPALMQVTGDGKAAWRTPLTMLTGRIEIVENKLCERSDGTVRGQLVCGQVYGPAEDGRYVYVNPLKLFRFAAS
ncbi:MAG: adenylate/guanylate cyclase domain-containing protein [Geminicoccaceae bacterium]